MFAVVWLLSWFLDIAATFMDADFGVSSLVSSEGVRWAMRNALPMLNNVPWGEIVLLLSALGLLQGAGIIRLLSGMIKGERPTRMQTRSLLFSVFAVLIYSTVVYVATFSQQNILLGVSGTIENSSFISGLPLLLFLGVLISALVYGFMYGNYRSAVDVVSSLGNTFSLFIPALIALIPASAVIASVVYTGFFDLIGLTNNEVGIIATVFYAIPFLHIMFEKRKS